MSQADPPRKPGRLFCFGLGYSARVLARRLAARGWRIAGTTRSAEAAAGLAAEGFEVRLFDREQPLAEAPALLQGSTHLLSAVPPDEAGDSVLGCHRDVIVACRSLAWIGYLSTTGVYGDRDGGWVDEDSALEPTGERGRRRATAEAAWLDLGAASGLAVQVFRLAGI
jgi:nucleoside-diphosphate-sugar epimerase